MSEREDRQRRLVASNEARFRHVNEELRERFEQDGEPSYVCLCECGDLTCTRAVRLSPEEYEAVRATPETFFVLRGHELHWAERTVEDHGSWLVVAKIGAGRLIAEALDDDR